MIKKFNSNMWISASEDGTHWQYRPNREDILKKINEIIDVVNGFEPKHGQWIPGKEIAREFLAGNVTHIDYLNYCCSVCGAIVGERETMMYHFCPNCGADMRGR